MTSVFSASDSRARRTAIRNLFLYLFIAFAGGIIVSAVSKALFHASLLDLAHRGLTDQILRAALLLLGFVIFPTLTLLELTREPCTYAGWNNKHLLKYFLSGIISGSLFMVCISFIIGTPRISNSLHSNREIFSDIFLSLLLWTILAIGEEGLNRGYAFVQLARALSFWPASVLSSLLFAAEHLPNRGESITGAVNAGLIGFVLAYSFYKTGSLWFALSFHMSWNFFQSFVFGFSNSGSRAGISLFSVTPAGPEWLTGGTAGPEAGVLVIPVSLLTLVIIRRISRTRSHSPIQQTNMNI